MTLVLGKRYRDILEPGLREAGADLLWLPDNPALGEPVAGHADLSLFMSRDGTAVTGEEVHPLLVNYLTNRGYTVLKSRKQGPEYPMDAGLCICETGKYSLYNPRTADPEAVRHLTGIPVEISQGYTRCSVCVVSAEAIITADRGICRKARNAGLDVLEIQPGFVELPGYAYGFIGGASLQLPDDVLAFTGSLRFHPDRDAMLAFLRNYGVKPVFLTDRPLLDIGSAVALP